MMNDKLQDTCAGMDRPGVKRVVEWPILILASFFLLATPAPRSRVDAILNGRIAPGTVETFASADLKSIGEEELAKWMPGSVTGLNLVVGEGWAEANGTVDFLRLQRDISGQDAGVLLRRILTGKRPVTLRVRVVSARGKARVDVERVTVSGIALEGMGLEFLLRTCVQPIFPEAVPGEWFPLDPHVERAVLLPGRVAVHVK